MAAGKKLALGSHVFLKDLKSPITIHAWWIFFQVVPEKKNVIVFKILKMNSLLYSNSTPLTMNSH
jgi:hypothetical protein